MNTFFTVPEQYKEVELAISLKSGDITIQSSNTTNIEIEMPDLRKGTFEELFEMTMYENKLTIKEKKQSGIGGRMFNFGGNNFSSDLIVKLPKSGLAYSGSLQLYSGDLKMNGIYFEGHVNTYNGDIEIENVDTKNLKINSYNGDLNLKDFHGNLAVEQYNGDISAAGCDFTGLKLKSFSGDISLKGKFLLADDGEISTFSGDIDLKASEYLTDKKLHISTMSGDLSANEAIPEECIVMKHKLKNGMEFMKGFKPMMKGIFDSIGNSMTGQKEKIHTEVIRSAGREEQETKEANIEKILQMLSEGKISFDESERLIKLLKV